MKTLKDLDKKQEESYKIAVTIGKVTLMVVYLYFFGLAVTLVCYLFS